MSNTLLHATPERNLCNITRNHRGPGMMVISIIPPLPPFVTCTGVKPPRVTHPGTNRDERCLTFIKGQPLYQRLYKSRRPQQGCISDIYTYTLLHFSLFYLNYDPKSHNWTQAVRNITGNYRGPGMMVISTQNTTAATICNVYRSKAIAGHQSRH